MHSGSSSDRRNAAVGRSVVRLSVWGRCSFADAAVATVTDDGGIDSDCGEEGSLRDC